MPRDSFDLSQVIEDFSVRIKDYLERIEDVRPGNRAAEPSGSAKSRQGFSPAVDLSMDLEGLHLEVDLPGLRKEQIRVNMSGDHALEISGRRDRTELGPERELLLDERPVGAFRRLVQLPKEIEVEFEQATARFEDGVLKVMLPLKKDGPHRPIEIQ